MLHVPNSDLNYVSTFTSSHITNYVCLVHIQYICDSRIDLAIEHKYKLTRAVQI